MVAVIRALDAVELEGLGLRTVILPLLIYDLDHHCNDGVELTGDYGELVTFLSYFLAL